MAMHDFFSAAEMKSGLVAIGRVEELVSAMQKEKDSAVRSADEKARWWPTVASALAVTDMSVLGHFVQLGGVVFLDQWLQEALQHSNNIGDSSLDDSTCELLRVLEKLSPDNKAPAFSGILVSVKNLIEHKSSRVQERAKALYDLLSRAMEMEGSHLISDTSECHDGAKILKSTASLTSSTVEHSTVAASPQSGADEDKQAIVLSGSELKCALSSDGLQSVSMKQNFSGTTRGQVDMKDSVVPVTPVQPSQHSVEELSTHLAGGTSPAITWAKSGELNSDKFVGKGISCISSLSGVDHVSPVNALDTQSVAEPAVKDTGVKESEHSVRTSLEDNALDSQDHGTTGQNDGICSNVSHDISVTGSILGKMENVTTSFHGEAKDVNAFAPDMLKKTGGCEDSATTDGISKPTTDVSADEMVNSEMDVEVRVAEEVEQEITDYREPLRSSFSQKIPEDTVVESGSSDSVNDKEGESMSEQENKKAGEQNSTGACISSKEGDDNLIDSKNEDKPEDSACHQNVSQVVEARQDAKNEKSAFGFDLNQDSNSDEMDQVKILVSSLSAASSSKATELESADTPTRRLKGKAIYDGSAATAALYPAASSSRSQDAQEAPVVEGGGGLKQRKGFMNFDLNIADENNDVTTNATVVDVPEASGLPSGESSVEVSSNKSRKLGLDLNLNSSFEEGDHSSSHSSVQPSVRNLDLNDNPPVHEAHGNPSDQVDGQYFKLMGANIPRDREDAIPQTRPFLSNQLDVSSQTRSFLQTELDITPQTRSFLAKEPVPVSLMASNYAQTGGAAAQAYVPFSPGFGYSNHHMEPFMSLSSEMFPSAVPPYMLESRAIPARQQAMGSFVAVQSPYSRSPFPTSTPGAPSGYNWMGPSQPNHDVSSSLFVTGVENSEQGTSRQAFVPGQANNLEEQTGSSSQLLRLKRREPDSGCDPHLGIYRRQPPWL